MRTLVISSPSSFMWRARSADRMSRPSELLDVLRWITPFSGPCRTFLFVALLLFSECVAYGSRRQVSSRPKEPKPIFMSTIQNITVNPGDRAVLRCRVDQLGTRTVTWRKQDETHPLTIGLFPFAPDVRLSVDYNQRSNEWSLVIQDVVASDEGVYHCQISTKDDDDSFDVYLHVKTVHVSGTEYVEQGSAIRLVCNATGRPEPPHNVEWYRDGVKINSDAQSGVIITKKIEPTVLVSMLVIQRSSMAHAGDYLCQSSSHDAANMVVRVLNDFLMSHRASNLKGISAERITSGQHRSSAVFVRHHAVTVYALTLATTLISSCFLIRPYTQHANTVRRLQT